MYELFCTELSVLSLPIQCDFTKLNLIVHMTHTTLGGTKMRRMCEPDQNLFSATTNKNGKKWSGYARLGLTTL